MKKLLTLLLTLPILGSIVFGQSQKTSRSEALMVLSYEDHTILYDATAESFYMLQHKATLQLPKDFKLSEFNQDQGKVVLRPILETGLGSDPVILSLDDNIYGMVEFTGTLYQKLWLVRSEEGVLEFNPEHPVEMSCHCYDKNDTSVQSQHGGEGSTGCSVSGSTLDDTWSCKVSCTEGYYSSCKLW